MSLPNGNQNKQLLFNEWVIDFYSQHIYAQELQKRKRATAMQDRYRQGPIETKNTMFHAKTEIFY